MIPLRFAEEAAFQLERAEEPKRLAALLAPIPLFLSLCQKEYMSGLLAMWRQLTSEGIQPEDYYLTTLSYAKRSVLLPEALHRLDSFFETRGSFDVSEQLLYQLQEWAQTHNDKLRMVQAQRGLGNLAYNRGNYPKAQSHFQETIALSKELGDEQGVSMGMGNLGIVYKEQGEYDLAMKCAEANLEIATRLHLPTGMASANGNIGNIHYEQGRYQEALDSFDRQFQLARSRSNKLSMSRAIGNKGMAYWSLGLFPEALHCYEQHMGIAESLGDRLGYSRAIGNAGNVYDEMGNYPKASFCYSQQAEIARSLGDKRGMCHALGNMGHIYIATGEYDRALASLRECTTVLREIGSLQGLVYPLLDLAVLLLTMSDGPQIQYRELSEVVTSKTTSWPDSVLEAANAYAKESFELSTRFGKEHSRNIASVVIARIQNKQGHSTLATERLASLLDGSPKPHVATNVHYWLWKFNSQEENKTKAIEGYTNLWSRTPKFEYRQRLAELRGEEIPRSA